MDIYWIKDKKRLGPATVPDIISRVQMGELTPDTLGWHAGCSTWVPLRELPALSDFLGDLKNRSKGKDTEEQSPLPTAKAGSAPPISIEVTVQASPSDFAEGSITLPLPRTRLMARLIDSALYSVIAAGIVYLLQIPFANIPLPLFWAPLIFIEALLLHKRGTTPGKAIMGITVSTFAPNQTMTFRRALYRSFSVNIIGMGCYLFPFALVTMGLSYYLLIKKGITMWDAQSFTLPLQRRKVGVRHYITAAILIYCSMQLTGLALLKTPGMIDLLKKTSPEAAQSILSVMPELQDNSTEQQQKTPSSPQPLQ